MNPEEFAMVAGLFDRPVYHQNGDDNAPIFDSIPAPTYTVEVGTTAWRMQDVQNPNTEKFVTGRTVVFDIQDLIKEYEYAGKVYSYLFRLPSQASPWVQMEVSVGNVIIL